MLYANSSCYGIYNAVYFTPQECVQAPYHVNGLRTVSKTLSIHYSNTRNEENTISQRDSRCGSCCTGNERYER